MKRILTILAASASIVSVIALVSLSTKKAPDVQTVPSVTCSQPYPDLVVYKRTKHLLATDPNTAMLYLRNHEGEESRLTAIARETVAHAATPPVDW